MPGEDEMLPLSGLQHLAFCPRQWALIHLEQVWVENRLTAEGRLLHERVDLPGQSRRDSVRTVRGMWLECRRLHLTGRAGVVEFRPQPYPLEYKRGKRKPTDCDTLRRTPMVAPHAGAWIETGRRVESSRAAFRTICADVQRHFLCVLLASLLPIGFSRRVIHLVWRLRAWAFFRDSALRPRVSVPSAPPFRSLRLRGYRWLAGRCLRGWS